MLPLFFDDADCATLSIRAKKASKKIDLTAGMNKSDNSNDVTSCVTWRYSVGLLACLTSCTEGPQERRGCSCYLFFMLFYELLFVHSCVHLRFLEDIFVCFALLMFPLVVFIFLLLISSRFCNSFFLLVVVVVYIFILFLVLGLAVVTVVIVIVLEIIVLVVGVSTFIILRLLRVI